MSKKNFTGGLSTVLGESSKSKSRSSEKVVRGRPKTNFKTITNKAQVGTKEGEIRATFIVREDLLEKLKAIAYWDRTLIKEVVDKALEEAVVKYEKKNGAIKPIPNK